jgi:hypothetical protein
LELVEKEKNPILKEDGIDLKELLTYVEPVISVRIRDKKFATSKRHFYPMKICTREDFESKDYIVTENF